MEQFIQQELEDIDEVNDEKKRKQIEKLFIFGLNKIKKQLADFKIFSHLEINKDYVSIYFVQFTLIIFEKQYFIPKKLLDYTDLEFKIEKYSNNLGQSDFVFKFLIGSLKFEFDELLDNRWSVEEKLGKLKNNRESRVQIKNEKEKNSEIDKTNVHIPPKILEKTIPESSEEISDDKFNQMENELAQHRNQFEIYEIEKQKRDAENMDLRNENIDLRNENADLKRKFCELEQVENNNYLEMNHRYNQQEQKIEELMAVFEIQQNQISEERLELQEQQNQIEEQENKIEEEQNYIQEQKKRSIEKNETIQKQEIAIKQEEEDKIFEIEKKSIEKNEIIQKKEEESKDQNEKLQNYSQTMQFIAYCMPESWNTIREKMYNFQNSRVKEFHFKNIRAAAEIAEQHFNSKNSTPGKSRSVTPTKSPYKKIKSEEK